MGTSIIPLDFESHAVRSVMIDGKPWWVAVDVCRVLRHSNPSVAIKRLDDDEKRVIDPKLLLGTSVAGGGAQMMSVITQGAAIALTLTSNLPVAKRLRRWITDEVVPALIRDGYYAMPGVIGAADQAEMAAKRAYFDALPERHKERARANAAAVRQVEDLIASGYRVSAAIAEVAEAVGLGERTLYSYRRIVWPVPEADWPLALAPRWSGPRGMVTDCHPEVLRLFLSLRASGARVSDCYRRVVEEAQAHGWAPLPPEYTLRRAGFRLAPPKSKKEAA